MKQFNQFEIEYNLMQVLLKQRDLRKLYKPPSPQDYSQNYRRLVIVILISFVFIAGQLIAGTISHSIAIISDAFHLISDTAGFFTAFLFLYFSRWPPNQKMTFGYHRMELIGAIANILIIWILIFVVVYESTYRIIDREFVQQPMVMLITAGGGLLVNIAMYKVLHDGSHHSHGLLADDCQHQHSHEHEHGQVHQHSHNQSQSKVSSGIPKTTKTFPQQHHEINVIQQQCFQNVCIEEECNFRVQTIHCHKDSAIHKHEPKNPQLPKLFPPKHHHIQDKTHSQTQNIKAYWEAAEKNDIEQPLIKKEPEQDHQNPGQFCLSQEIIRNRQHQHSHQNSQENKHDFKKHKHSHEKQPQQPKLHHAHSHKSSPKKAQEPKHQPHGKHHHHSVNEYKKPKKQAHKHQRCDEDGHKHKHNVEKSDRTLSIGMQAAVLHALSDMIMSIGLIISSLFIFFFGNPGKAYNENVTQWNPWHLFDPISTYLFSILALASTIPVLRNSYNLLMEGTPSYINLAELKRKCEEIDGVINVHDIHVWDLKPGKTCMIGHILARKGTERKVLVELSDIARHNKIFHSTFQVQEEEWKDQESYILCDHDIH